MTANTTTKSAALAAKLEIVRASIKRLEVDAARRSAIADSNSLPNDPGAWSGIRRKPNPRADARRHASYSAETAAYQALSLARESAERLERQLAIAIDEETRHRFTQEECAGARYVRDRLGWHEVVRVNAKSITVRTPWSWNESVLLDKVLEVRS